MVFEMDSKLSTAGNMELSNGFELLSFSPSTSSASVVILLLISFVNGDGGGGNPALLVAINPAELDEKCGSFQ